MTHVVFAAISHRLVILEPVLLKPNSGRWGTGFVEAKFKSLDQLPYMVGLARQALEKQLGDDN